ncbi:hypothetical protein BST81_14340 [Leptolyngbya sp. 'hensonii']|uniref:DUF3122 domain-containing protein n=1 Tax=Leptolyngbya sp. 'hensonii' TaxID=1922337 RepID=UPI0009500E41|nr:DUF3122 domain-containing protein [Leptolyngbya sp. 'hensonii']OLP17515.1 hypothetical protein BST81_14340 [Leptolyngbya sp. 'hensonii']
MGCKLRKMLSWLLLLGAIVLGLVLGLGILSPARATAAIRQLEEAPRQRVYQSRQTLKDQQGHNWQVIAFNRIRPNGSTSFDIRLVGFPGVVEIDRSRPLMLTNSLGQTLRAADASGNLFTETAHPEPYVGQYDLQPLLSQVQTEIPLQIILPTIGGEAVRLSISPLLIQEWKVIANYGNSDV